MKTIRGIGTYDVALDVTETGIGWVAVDEEGTPLRHGRQPVWGVRTFSKAETALETRLHRSMRRRYERRRWRLGFLKEMFAERLAEVDPDFLGRLANSGVAEGPDAVVLAGPGLDARELRERFPTTWHLRAWLTTADEPADLRLVYLACHHIVKWRGNFLREGEDVSSRHADVTGAAGAFAEALADWLEARELPRPSDEGAVAESIAKVLAAKSLGRRERAKALARALGLGATESAAARALASMVMGLKADPSKVFEGIEGTSLSLDDEEATESLLDSLEGEDAELFEAVRSLRSAWLLVGLLDAGSGPLSTGACAGLSGSSLSFCKVRAYERYGRDLACLRRLVRTYAPSAYDAFFRGPVTESGAYDPDRAGGYTLYDLDHGRAYEDFAKDVRRLLAGLAADDPEWRRVDEELSEGTFLRRLRTRDNASVPYQLNLEELDLILRSQGRFHPFLLEARERIESLVSFRIPYYVGPLTMRDAATGHDGVPRFAWAKRREGREGARVTPWAWEDVIDREGAAEVFMGRLTGECTYLVGEPVLPKSSLLYEEFCVLNELAGARWSVDGDDWPRMDARMRRGLMRDLFSRRRHVTYRAAASWIERERGWAHVQVRGGQGKDAFGSSMPAHIFFAWDVFDGSIPDDARDTVESVILWSTVFEDRQILRSRLLDAFGPDSATPVFDECQVRTITRKRLKGWGRLSRRLLEGVEADTQEGPLTVMGALLHGVPRPRAGVATMNLQEMLRDPRLGFRERIEALNDSRARSARLTLDDLPGSPALRRPVGQAVAILGELARVAGTAPRRVYLTTPRPRKMEAQQAKRRFDRVREAVKGLAERDPHLVEELSDLKAQDFSDPKLYLYFLQAGRSMVTGDPIDLARLPECRLEHVIPPSYERDDGLENRFLTGPGEVVPRGQDLLVTGDVRRSMAPRWRELKSMGLMSDRKLKNLLDPDLTDQRLASMVARQLTTGGWTLRLMRMMLSSSYPTARVVPVRHSLVTGLKRSLDIIECPWASDDHLAHSALACASLGRFLLTRTEVGLTDPANSAQAVRRLISLRAKGQKAPDAATDQGIVVASFSVSGVTPEAPFDDGWDADRESSLLRRMAGVRQVHQTRKAESTGGALWKATIYPSSDVGRRRLIPVKEGRDPSRFGGYTGQQSAYFCVCEVLTNRGGRRMELVPVPMAAARKVDEGTIDLGSAVSDVLEPAGQRLVRIVRRRVLKYQLIEVGGERLYVTGAKELRSAMRPSLSQVECYAMGHVATDDPTWAPVLEGFESRIVHASPRLAKAVGMPGLTEGLEGLDPGERQAILYGVMAVVTARSNSVDLTPVGGIRNAGRIAVTWSKLLSQPGGVTFIDQSVTGLFETRQRIGAS